jgi:HTH-type transcriptional regulator/antitoxin HigA
MASRTTIHRFEPDYAVAPGATLAETLSAIGISQADLARRSGLSPKHVSQLVSGDAPLSADTAVRLERVTGVPSRMWSALEAQYRTQLKRQEERSRLRQDVGWLRTLPVKELVARGAIEASEDKATLLERVLGFFGVSSIDAWNKEWQSPQAVFRRSQASSSQPGAIAAWIRLGEDQARRLGCQPYSESAFRESLSEARSLTKHGPQEFEGRLRELCAGAGVVLVLVREIKMAPVSGATRWLSPQKAMIALSLRYKSNDQFWFSFFHEAGHVIKHPKRDGFVDIPGSGQGDAIEAEADAFASNVLIPPHHQERLRTLRTATAIRSFADEIGIHPGIVVGRLQHEKLISHAALNHLKMRLAWSEEE